MSKKKTEISPYARRNLIKRILNQAGDAGFTITQIHDIFSKEHSHDVSRKTIERDIENLSESSGVYVVNESESTKAYAISSDYAEVLEVSLSEEHLQTLNLALGLLFKLGPSALSKIVSEAENSLVEALPDKLKKDFENFKTLQSIQSSIAGKSILKDGEDLKTVLLALRKGRMIECDYFSKYRGVTELRELGPISIELFGGSPYLLAEDVDDEENPIKRFKLSRLSEAKILKSPYTPPDKTECERFLNSFAGVGGNPQEIQKIKVWGSERFGEHFKEIELHPSQKLSKEGENFYSVEFEMPLAYDLIRYFAGFGGEISKMEPKELFFKVRSLWKKGLEKIESA